MSWPFELRDARNSRVSDDGMSDDSNFEHLSPEDGAAPLEEVVLQWLGERVLSSRLAQMIVCHAPANITSGDLDVSRIRPLSWPESTDPKKISCGCFSRRSQFLTQNGCRRLPLAEARSGKKIRIARESQYSELTALP